MIHSLTLISGTVPSRKLDPCRTENWSLVLEQVGFKANDGGEVEFIEASRGS
ncbi:hypothetical protein NC652_027039 [Populus alba x Populus x berolinensis]|nr:hypothetical protein NC652_027039 [Populus alba x Populus x berolinensis]